MSAYDKFHYNQFCYNVIVAILMRPCIIENHVTKIGSDKKKLLSNLVSLLVAEIT